MPDLYTHEEVARLFDRPVSWVQNMIVTGGLPLGVPSDGRWLVPAHHVETLYRSSLENPLPEPRTWRETVADLSREKNAVSEKIETLRSWQRTPAEVEQLQRLEAERVRVVSRRRACEELGVKLGLGRYGPSVDEILKEHTDRQGWLTLGRNRRKKIKIRLWQIENGIEDLERGPRSTRAIAELRRLREERTSILASVPKPNAVRDTKLFPKTSTYQTFTYWPKGPGKVRLRTGRED